MDSTARMNPYPYIDVESLFTEMVRSYPMACVLTDVYPHPESKNADYLFHHEKIVAELKRIEIDNTDSPSNQAKVGAVLDKYLAEGKIKTKEITRENWQSLPRELHNEIYNITTGSIKSHVEKANKQIKQTKEKFGLRDYKGCLIIANDGVVSLPPAAFCWALVRLLTHHFSSIDCFIFFSANVLGVTREHPAPLHYWLPTDMQRNGKDMDMSFSLRLFESWKSIIKLKSGIPDFTVGMDDPEGFWKARNLPN